MNNSRSDVDVAILDLLKDCEWHGFGEILNKVGIIITAEKATQHFRIKVCKKQVNRPLEEQVGMGRRWKVSGACAKLVRKGKILARGIGFQQEYSLCSKEIPRLGQEATLMATPPTGDVFDNFYTACMNAKGLESGEIDDLLFHVRSIKRILRR
jgi:hypothetical protein